MSDKNDKKKLSKNNIFQISVGITGVLSLFTFFNLNNIQSDISSINIFEKKIDTEKKNIKEAENEIRKIKEEFNDKEISKPIDLDGRIPLVIRDIKQLIISKNIKAEINIFNKGRSATSDFERDNETGLKKITLEASLEYERYQDVKDMLKELKTSFPLSIDKIVFNSKGSAIKFTIYGK